MERIRNLYRYQKVILLILIVMAVVFAVLYAVTTSRTGFSYMDKILIPETRDGATVYSGIIGGEKAWFTVSGDKSVTFRHGDRLYGPYTAVEAPDAVPEEDSLAEQMTGVEVRNGDKIIFRGSVLPTGYDDQDFILLDEKGNLDGVHVMVHMSDGTVVDGDGNTVDPMEPDVYTILHLMQGPELTAKGHWGVYFLCLVMSAVTAVSIVFADELFRFGLSFRIRNADMAEPSDWALMNRSISWFIAPVGILVCYIIGLFV